jgi:hypothetical protein
MIDLWKTITASQFEAALSMLNRCIEECSDAAWDGPVANLKFCQVVFHTLFYVDCYLGQDGKDFLQQPFHREHPEFFGDYEEMENRAQKQTYDRPTIVLYLEHCRRKVAEVIAAETPQSLAAQSGFYWLPFPRAEVYIYNIRHVQHHAAQLSLCLRLDAGVDIPWARSGWGK